MSTPLRYAGPGAMEREPPAESTRTSAPYRARVSHLKSLMPTMMANTPAPMVATDATASVSSAGSVIAAALAAATPPERAARARARAVLRLENFMMISFQEVDTSSPVSRVLTIIRQAQAAAHVATMTTDMAAPSSVDRFRGDHCTA